MSEIALDQIAKIGKVLCELGGLISYASQPSEIRLSDERIQDLQTRALQANHVLIKLYAKEKMSDNRDKKDKGKEQRMKNRKKRKRARSAITGRFITLKQAEKKPSTSIIERY